MRKLKFALLPLAALVLGSGIAEAQGSQVYRYCLLRKDRTVYYTTVFRVDAGVYHVGIQNAYNSYVTARHDPNAISGSICMGPYDSYQEAEDSRNDNIGDERRSGYGVMVDNWAYRGD